ncbi:hypothetical protein AZA_88755 [Nitrospirillum viridazoti Y2]|nr:hypothetical protein AZA_88755 [Nitrospirillum amazonense Y2]
MPLPRPRLSKPWTRAGALVRSRLALVLKPGRFSRMARPSTRSAAACTASGWASRSAAFSAGTMAVQGKGHCVVTPSIRPAAASISISPRSWLSPTSPQGEAPAKPVVPSKRNSAPANRRPITPVRILRVPYGRTRPQHRGRAPP